MTAPAAVTMSCPRGEWGGSFGLAVGTFIEDVLSDGMPFNAVVTLFDDTVHPATTIVAYQGGWIRFDDDTRVGIDDVTMIEVQ